MSAPRIGVQISRRAVVLAVLALVYAVLFLAGNAVMSLIVHLVS